MTRIFMPLQNPCSRARVQCRGAEPHASGKDGRELTQGDKIAGFSLLPCV